MTTDDLLSMLHEAGELLVELSQSTHDRKAVLDARDLARRIDDALADEDWTPTGREVKPVDPIYDDYLAGRIDKAELARRLAALSDDQ